MGCCTKKGRHLHIFRASVFVGPSIRDVLIVVHVQVSEWYSHCKCNGIELEASRGDSGVGLTHAT